MSDVVARVRSVIAAQGHLAKDISLLGDGDDLYEIGLSSHATVNLMLALENEFDVEFPDAVLQRSTFQTVEAISAALVSLGAG